MRRLGWVVLVGAIVCVAAVFGLGRRENRADRARKSGAI